MPGTPAAPLEGRDALGAQRPLTVGILLGVTLVAFESLAVVTVAPRLAEELGGVALYGWMFSGFLLASLLGTVVAGQMADTGTLARPLALGLAAFGLGLAVSGSAPTMLVVIAGRVLQGLGGGALSTVMLTAITRAYPDSQRARMMALTSSAWVVPALLGPTVAGFVAEALHWRLVFWGIVPLLLVVGAMTVPRFRHLDPPVAARPPRGRLAGALTLALGTGLFLTGLGAWLYANPADELARAVATFFPDVPQDILVRALGRYKDAGLWSRDTRMNPQGFARLAQSLHSGGFIARMPAYEECVEPALNEIKPTN